MLDIHVDWWYAVVADPLPGAAPAALNNLQSLVVVQSLVAYKERSNPAHKYHN